ncbi:MAG: four helix bundle protein [Bacteroidetes bacterium]|jgi:four helix bundle protein|nr:four helix bundle protein [Bacteroidota bacterium]
MAYRGFRDLKVYQLAYQLALEIFNETKSFPKEERYDLTAQIRKSSRSVPRNIAEAWRRRVYPKAFFNKLVDSSAEADETEVSLDMSLDCGYVLGEKHRYFIERYEELQRMLSGMMAHPERFSTRQQPPE